MGVDEVDWMNKGGVTICLWPFLDIPFIHLIAYLAQVSVLSCIPRGSGGIECIAIDLVH